MFRLDWPSESYVRLYRTNDEIWECLCWEARALYPLLRRAVNRAGVLQTAMGYGGIVRVVRVPLEVVTAGMDGRDGPGLLEVGAVAVCAAGFVIPHFLESDEAKSSDKTRQRERRARIRDTAVAESRAPQPPDKMSREHRVSDTASREASFPFTDERKPFTSSREAQISDTDPEKREKMSLPPSLRAVTVGHENGSSRPGGEGSERVTRRAEAHRLYLLQEQLRREVDPSARPTAQIHCEDTITVALGHHSAETLEHVLRVYAGEARTQPAGQKLRWFNGAGHWKNDAIERVKDLPIPGAPAAPGGYIPPPPGTPLGDGYVQATPLVRVPRPGAPGAIGDAIGAAIAGKPTR